MKRFKAQQVYVSIIMLILGVLLIAGCGGSDEAALVEAQHDSVLPGNCTAAGPKVLSAIPSNNQENVAIDTTITVLFDEAMDPTTIVVTDSGNPQVLTFTLRDNNQAYNTKGTVAMSLLNVGAIFTPTTALNGDSWYTVTITDYAKNAGGTSLGCSYQWSFKTAVVN